MRTSSPRGAITRALLVSLIACCTSPSAASAQSLLTPSNADTAFMQIPLLAPSGGSGHVLDVGHAIWPSLLDNPALMRAIGGNDSILVSSTRLRGVSVNLDGSVTYALPAGTYANRVGTIVTANDWTDAGDGTLPVLTASFTFSDGRQWGSGTALDVPTNSGKALSLVHQVRNWSNQVMPSRPDFVLRPGDPRVFALYGGPAVGAGDSVFCDLQTFNIPDTLRSAQLSTVTFSSHSEVFGFPITSTTALITGVVVWPSFDIVNARGDSVVLQRQLGTWSGDPYGGYFYNDTLVGQHRTIGELGCVAACLSMVNEFYGATSTPDTVTRYLQRRPQGDGFFPFVQCRIKSVAGSAVTFSILDTTSTIGPTFLIQDGRMAPRATVSVTSIDPGDTTGSGTITQRFRGGVVSVGDRGVVFDEVNYTAGSEGFSSDTWGVRGFYRPATAALVESTLAANSPVLLYTGVGPSGASHWVVGHGREPAFVASSDARGTYHIKDPANLDSGVPLRRLLQNPHNNVFQDAVACSLITPGPKPKRAAARTLQDGAGLVIRLQGDATLLSVRDPVGNAVTYGAAEAYDVGILGALAIRRHRIADPFDPTVHTGVSDVVHLPAVADGPYVINVVGQNGVAYILSADAADGTGAESNAIIEDVIVGGTRRILLNCTATTVSVVAVTSVGDHERPGIGVTLRAHPNPSSGSTRLEFVIPQAGTVEVTVLDIQGRRVATLLNGVRTAGPVSLGWDGRFSDGPRVPAGIYLARVTVNGGSVVKRLAVLR